MATDVLEVDRSSCSVSWHGCREVYNAVHTCDRHQRHDGRHRCVCGATKARKK